MNKIDFNAAFTALTGNSPFPWQFALYEEWFSQGKFPASCNLPTGLGKTSVIAIWLIALANQAAKIPRRLVYVVNRRTVVDQTTDEVENYARLLAHGRTPLLPILIDLSATLRSMSADPKSNPLAISTLRGQFADNREWSADPSRPAVICGTVDMIGSRLLFSGYGCGFKTRPLHAGFLGQDALLVHDEAHLEPAFQTLIEAIRDEQKREPAPLGEWMRLKVMELTATSRAGAEEPFELKPEDYENDTVKQRVNAKKAVKLVPNKDEKKLADEIADLALKYKESGRAILIFVSKVDDVEKIVKKLPKDSYEQLTGTLRGLERDGLVKKPIFQRFLPSSNRDKDVTPQPGTVYLVCTSAGEVGVNISADHLICDLSTFESMAQRFGRVNRFGICDDTEIHVIHSTVFENDDHDIRLSRTLELLSKLNGNGSPTALRSLQQLAIREGSGIEPMSTDRTEELRKYILAAYASQPTIISTSDILFDAWALTTIREKLPGRPPVEPYLHGISDDPPQTTVAWREEVEVLTLEVLQQNRLDSEAILEMFPVKPHEELSGPTYGKNKVFEQLEKIAERNAKREPDKRLSAWVIDPDGTVQIYTLAKLVEKDRQNKPTVALGGRTVLLPPSAGGFSCGLLKGDEPHTLGIPYDVSSELYVDPERTMRRRFRAWDDVNFDAAVERMREVRRIDFPPTGDDEDAEGLAWHWFELPHGADDDGSKAAATRKPITWDHHTNDVTSNAERIVMARGLPEDLRHALILAAKFHDLGKKREVWQRSIGNPNPKNWCAKSARGWVSRELTDYRHEFGSLVEVTFDPEITSHPHRELILHLIATHHGYGRPHFPKDKAFDVEPKGRDVEKVACEVPQRFARLQRKYGRWGLAYLESLLRAADYAASANPSEFMKETLCVVGSNADPTSRSERESVRVYEGDAVSFAVNVDPTNPGQFFACCGLLELADRLWDGAEGWFAEGKFHVTCGGTLADLITRFAQAQIDSSLSAPQLKRLGTLLSLAEAKLTAAHIEEKAQLKEMWKFERLHVSAPFDIWIDWWRDERGERTDLKTWAAKQMVAEMAQKMLSAIKAAGWTKSPNPEAIFQTVRADSLPFNFDSDLSGQGSARDTGFSADTLSLKSEFRPLLELVAFIGLQRFRPAPMKDERLCFSLWSTPLPPSVAAAAAIGAIDTSNEQLYKFALFSRTKYMKSFLPAQPQQGVK